MTTSTPTTTPALTIRPPRLPYVPETKDRYGIDEEAWRALVEAIFPTAQSVGSIILVLAYCKSRNLDVFKRNVHTLLLCGDTSPGLWLTFNYYDIAKAPQWNLMDANRCTVVRDQWYTVELEVRGQQLRGYLDGKLLVEATDERLTKGSLRLAGVNATVLVDDFGVYPLP